MALTFKEESSDGDAGPATTHHDHATHATGAAGHQDEDDSSVAALTNIPTAATADQIVARSPVRRELTREKIAEAAKKSKEWGISHIKHKWKWYLVGLVIFLAILLPIIFLVALPAIVQLIVNQQTLPVYGGALVVQDPRTIRVTLDSAFRIPPGLAAKTNSFSLELYDKNAPVFSPFLHLQVPPLNLKGGSTNFTIKDQAQPVLNEESLTNWFATFFDQEIVDLSVRGTGAEISLGALKSHPRLDKTITMTGLEGLHGITMERLEFLVPPSNGNNIRGSLLLPNRSPLRLTIGDMKLTLLSGDLNIGNILLKDLQLEPGNHTQSIEGFLDFNAIISNLGAFLASQSTALGKGIVELNVTAREITREGEHVVFLEKILGTRPLTVPISVVTLASDLLSGFLKPAGITGNGPQNGTAFVNALSGVFSNQTLLNGLASRWNITSKGGGGKAIASRSLLGDSTMWNLMKLGLQMRSLQR